MTATPPGPPDAEMPDPHRGAGRGRAAAARAAKLLNQVVLAVSGLLLVAMIVVAAVGVFYRYVLQYSLSWTEEAASYLFIWLTFLGAASDVWSGGHPAITFLVDRVPPGPRAVARLLALGAVGAWGLILLIDGVKSVLLEAPESWASIPSFSLQGPYAAIPAGGALILLFAAVRAALRP